MALSLNVTTHPTDSASPGVPLVIAHGLFGQARNFGALVKGFATDRQVIAVDMRNHGDSPWDDDMTYPAMAGDLATVIRDHAGGRAVLLGHSMGGKAAMAMALAAPDLLEGLIIADIAPVAYDHSHLGYIRAMMALDLTSISRRSDADQALVSDISDAATRAFILQNLVIRPDEKRWKLNLAVLESAMDELVGWPGDLAGGYSGSALFLYGGASSYMGQDHRGAVEGLFPQAAYAEIPGAGHWLHAEKPTEFSAAVVAYLATL